MPHLLNQLFRTVATTVSRVVGTPGAFVFAFLLILTWAFTGHFFGYSDTWQLVINTGTTIITFLMVFLIQNTQNRDSRAVHIKLDELIRSEKGARNTIMNIEEIDDTKLEELQVEFRQLHERYTLALQNRQAKRKTGQSAIKK